MAGFVNHTAFPALAFEGIDQHAQAFHVLVLRQTLTWNRSGQLSYADNQQPLCEVDEFIGKMNQSSVRQESDLCHYKPRCDVIVNAVAHAPGNQAVPQFGVHLALRKPNVEKPFLSKTLRITGKRDFVWSNGHLEEQGKTLSKGWHLTEPAAISRLPVCYEFAFGGQCRINQGDEAAQRIQAQYRLTPEQQASHPDAQCPELERPIAHSVCMTNPVGRGFVPFWYAQALNATRFAAPQIEPWARPLTANDFERCFNGQLSDSEAADLTAGLMIRPKAHPERSRLSGTIDEAFIRSSAWLPTDFDFAVWNAAPPDQQVEHLQGDEWIELFNLCSPDAPGAQVTERGDTFLRLMLPGQSCFVLVRLENGILFTQPMMIDTVIIEPQLLRVHLVWRMILGKDPELPVRVLEARMRSIAERDAVNAEAQQLLDKIVAAAQSNANTQPANMNAASAATFDFAAWFEEETRRG